jgi:hypothetical protein
VTNVENCKMNKSNGGKCIILNHGHRFVFLRSSSIDIIQADFFVRLTSQRSCLENSDRIERPSAFVKPAVKDLNMMKYTVVIDMTVVTRNKKIILNAINLAKYFLTAEISCSSTDGQIGYRLWTLGVGCSERRVSADQDVSSFKIRSV